MSKWVDVHKIMIEKDQWYVTIEDVEDLIEEFNKEIEVVRGRLTKEQRKHITYREMVRQGIRLEEE